MSLSTLHSLVTWSNSLQSHLASDSPTQLDRIILGLTSPSYSTFEDIIPATPGSPSQAAAPNHQPSLLGLRRHPLNNIYQELDKPPLPNLHESSLPFLPGMRIHEPGWAGQALLQTLCGLQRGRRSVTLVERQEARRSLLLARHITSSYRLQTVQ